MPRTLTIAPSFDWLLAEQDHVITRRQALGAGLTRHAIGNRIDRHGWQELLPNVFLTHAGEPSRRQMYIAAVLWAGPEAAIDGRDALRFHGVEGVPLLEDIVHVVVPADSGARSRQFVRVRRSIAPIDVVATKVVRYVGPATAAITVARDLQSDRAVLAILSAAVQQRTCTVQQLMVAHVRAPRANGARTDRALAALTGGVRSAPEGDFRLLAEASPIVPPLLYNALLQLPCGRLVSPDALALDAGLVHETNGRKHHAREDRFESMHERHEVMTVAGLTVLHSTPRQLWAEGRRVINGFERCYARLSGTGLPPGVLLLRPGASDGALTAG